MLYRREIYSVGSDRRYQEPALGNDKAVRIASITDLPSHDLVLYTLIAANITPLTVELLAGLAIESACQNGEGRDGISYLLAAKSNGIATPLSADYEAEILRRTGAPDLAEALALTRSQMS